MGNSFDRIQERSDHGFPRGRWEGVSTTHNSDLNAVFWCTVVTGLDLSRRRSIACVDPSASTRRKGNDIPSAPAALSTCFVLDRAASLTGIAKGPAPRCRILHHAIAVEIRSAGLTPGHAEQSEVGTIGHAVTVEVNVDPTGLPWLAATVWEVMTGQFLRARFVLESVVTPLWPWGPLEWRWISISDGTSGSNAPGVPGSWSVQTGTSS